MYIRKLSKFLAFVLAVVMVVSIIPPIKVCAADESWTLDEDTEIFWVDGDMTNEALVQQIQLFSSELAEKVTEDPLNITCGSLAEAGEDDIILVLDSTLNIAAQGYQVTADDDCVTIAASDADGLFYGCRYLIKELLLNQAVASASNAPKVGERAVSLDNGRKYFTVDWIKQLIREMSWANMNALALHFSEEMGLGIESRLYPWLNGRDGTLCTQAEVATDNTILTQEEVKEIVEYAKLYHVEIIPSLDSPGHMNYIVKKFNEQCADQDFSFTYRGVTYTAQAGSEIGNYYHYNGQTTIVKGSRNANYSRGIDISNEVAVAFTKSLIEEYATFFAELGCTKFDIGGDELLGWGSAIVSSVNKWQQLDHWKTYAQSRTGNSSAVAYDAFLLYMNDLNDLVRELDYTSVRMWNDDALRSSDTGWTGVVQLNTDIDIWFWTTGTNKYATYTDAGYEVYNILGDYNYYAMTSNYFSDSRSSFAYAYEEQIYNYWNPFEYNIVTGSSRDYAEWNDTRVKGGAFGIWCDNPDLKTQEEVMTEVLPLIRANAAKCWYPGAHGLVNYDTYKANWETCGSAPAGTITAPEIYVIPDLTALETAVADFETVDGTLYTEESYAAYTLAVANGKVLLTAEKPTQAEANAAEAAIKTAKAALALLPTVDTEELEAAVADAATVDSALYTAESYAAYANAVAAGEALLAAENPTQEEVDAAAAAIEAAKAALTLLPAADTTELEALIAAYDQADQAQYTGESFISYMAAVAEGKSLLASGVFTTSQLDAAAAAIREAEAALEVLPESGVSCILNGNVKSKRVYVNSVVNFTISTDKDKDTVGLCVVDENGQQIKATRYALNTRQTARDVHTFVFKVKAEDRGTHVYTVYAVLSDGTLSADFVQFTVEVR